MSPRPDLRGFTVIETVTVMLIVSVLTRIVVPQYQDVRLMAQATQIAADFNVVHIAAEEFFSEHHRWPEDTGPGEVPEELAPFLNEGFTFEKDTYKIDWENWVLPDGTPKHPETRVLLGVSVTTDNPALGHAVSELLRDRAKLTLGSRYTFIFEAM